MKPIVAVLWQAFMALDVERLACSVDGSIAYITRGASQ